MDHECPKTNIEDKCCKRIALDVDCKIPGKITLDTFVQIAETTDKVIIVLSPEQNENKWLQYQAVLALEDRDPEKILVCYLGEISHQNPISRWLEPIQTIDYPCTSDHSLCKSYQFVREHDI